MSNVSLSDHITRADKIMWFPLGLIILLSLLVGLFTQTLWLAMLNGLITLPLTLAAQYRFPGHIVNGFVKAAVMMSWSAVLIEQSGGLIEAHFSIFILLSVLILYSDWRVIAFGGLVIALHHVLFTWLQYQQVVQLYSGMVGSDHGASHGASELIACLLMHGGAVVVQVAILGYLAKVLGSMVREGQHVSQFAYSAGGGNLAMHFTEEDQQLPAVAAVVKMRDQVADSLRETQNAASQVSDYSQQLFNAQQELYKQTARNSSQTERISASTTELAATTRETAKESQSVRELATYAEQVARKNGEQVETMREMMHSLNQNASNIGTMLSEIDNITFQTNLLALNASVEAARAGVHGLGFAVVANEVRKLASNTQNTAMRIRETIDKTTDLVLEGVAQTTTVAETTQSLVTSFVQVAERLTSMDNAVQQQHLGVEELEQSVNEIHNALEMSRQAVDEAQHMSNQLSVTADTMMRAVSGFTLPEAIYSQRPLPALQ